VAEATALSEGDTQDMRVPLITIRDVEVVFQDIAPGAVVSTDAVVGAPAEWRDRPTKFPAIVGDGATIREFARVHGGCERPTIIGAGTLLMAGSHVGHDAQLGSGCEVAPNAVIGGCVTIGKRVRIGMGAMICPHVTIPDDVRIGAGAVVNRSIEPADVPQTWVGNPARRIR
jgi:acyl-[acyl carrier protein]--UDP-N-acetylglucosamine O-acyltransferase